MTDQLTPKAAYDAMVNVQEIAQRHEHFTRKVHAHLEGINTPAAWRAVRLTSNQWRERWDQDGRSIALYNPTTVTAYLGLGGGTAEPGTEAWSVPPNSLLVLPLNIDTAGVEIGVAKADVANADAVVFAVAFAAVQPMFFGAL